MNDAKASRRSLVKSGDILAWSKDQSTGKFKLFLPIVRFLTSSEYGHIGIAEVIGEDIYVYEATIPYVRKRLVREDEQFYCCSMGLSPSSSDFDWFSDKLGSPYSMKDAIQAYLGLTVDDDNRWQCAELAKEFLKSLDIYLDCNPTPTEVIEAVMRQHGAGMLLIK